MPTGESTETDPCRRVTLTGNDEKVARRVPTGVAQRHLAPDDGEAGLIDQLRVLEDGANVAQLAQRLLPNDIRNAARRIRFALEVAGHIAIRRKHLAFEPRHVGLQRSMRTPGDRPPGQVDGSSTTRSPRRLLFGGSSGPECRAAHRSADARSPCVHGGCWACSRPRHSLQYQDLKQVSREGQERIGS